MFVLLDERSNSDETCLIVEILGDGEEEGGGAVTVGTGSDLAASLVACYGHGNGKDITAHREDAAAKENGVLRIPTRRGRKARLAWLEEV